MSKNRQAAVRYALSLLLLVPFPEGLAMAQSAPSEPAAVPAAAPPAEAAPPVVSPPPEAAPGPGAPSYEDLLRRVEALERARAEEAPPSVGEVSTAATFTQNRFNPDISVIADFALVGVNLPDDEAETLTVPGLLDATERLGKFRGLDFNYFELAVNAAVDPFFEFAGVVTIGAEGFDVEETYIESRQLPFGLQLKLGKFLSAFGRINGQHKHFWDFYDAPLVYETFIGGEGLKNPGARLSWTAPVDFLLQVTAEVFQGVFDESATFNAVGYELAAEDGTTLSEKAPFVPGLYVGSVKTSFDFGNHVFLLGGSVMYGHSTREGEGEVFFAPGTVLYGGELTYKYLLSSYRNITWQTEYLGRISSGDLALASDGRVHHQDKRQGGFYSQLLWRFDGQWRAGARFDLITENSVSIDDVAQPLDNLLQRYTAMLEYGPSEFARFRLQYAFDRSRYLEGVRRDVHEVLLQVNVAIGPHGAHSF